jgi:parvulin-like peptidyl-prolyl isomerase
VLCLLPNYTGAQVKEGIIAKVGNLEISAEEFNDRLQLSPFFTDRKENPDSMKRKFLFSLIAEKLWAQKAHDNHLDTMEIYINSMNALEELFLKNELYKFKITNKIEISGTEISQGLQKFSKLLNITLFASKDSLLISNFYESLNSSETFESKNSEIFNQIIIRNSDVTFGDFENTDLEDSVFALGENQITKPFETTNGWIVAQLIKENINPRIENENPQTIRDLVYKIIYDRKAFSLSEEFLNQTIGGLKAKADFRKFSKVSENLLKIILKKYKSVSDSVQGEFTIDENIFVDLLSSIPLDERSDEFVKINGNNKTLTDFLFYLSNQRFTLNTISQKSIVDQLNIKVRSFIEQSVLTQKALDLNLSNSPELKRDLMMWSENYLSQIAIDKFVKNLSVTQEELYKFYKSNYNSVAQIPRINILEILNNDLEIIEKVLIELEDGKDFRELAKKYSQREIVKNNGGEWGLFPITEGGDLGKAAAALKIGEITGPIKTADGYSIIKLINRTTSMDSSSLSYDSLKTFLELQVRLNKIELFLNNSTADLAVEKGVKINESLFNSIETIPIKIFTVRFLGFGGKITAFPLTVPNYTWYNDYKNRSKILP